MSSYSLHKPLRSTAIDTAYRGIDEPWFIWFLAQAQSLSSATTLLVSSRCIDDQPQALMFQRLLDTMYSLRYLKILASPLFEVLSSMPMPPTLIKHQSIESLEIQISGNNVQHSQVWITWLWNILHTATSLRLAVIWLTMDAVDFLDIGILFRRFARMSGLVQPTNIQLGDIDDYLSIKPHLRQLCITVGIIQMTSCRRQGQQN